MELATTITGYSQQLIYASNINLSTNVITFSISNSTAEYLPSIYKVVFKEITLKPLPTNILSNEVYFLRKINSTTCKLYTTEANALAQTNAVDWTSENVASVSTYFAMYYISKKYNILECIELGAAEVEDIICCPPSVATLPPSTATITQGDGSTTIATIAQGFPHVNITRFRHYGFVNMFQQPNISYRHEVLIENTLSDFTGLGFISYAPPIAGGRNISATFDLKAAPLTFTCVSIYAVGHASYWPPVTVVFSGVMDIPDVRLTMTDSKFVKEGTDITIGNIDVTLTYDAVSGYWFGPLENYYNIPGRLHMNLEIVKPGETFSKNFAPGAPMIFNASGFNGGSPNKPFFIPITIGLDYESYETPMLLGDVGGVTAGFEGTLYYTTTSFAIKYSTYNSARKPKDYFYQYAFFPYEPGSFYGGTNYQTSDFFNSNNYWLSSVNATMEFITPP